MPKLWNHNSARVHRAICNDNSGKLPPAPKGGLLVVTGCWNDNSGWDATDAKSNDTCQNIGMSTCDGLPLMLELCDDKSVGLANI
eukprot:1543688-Amphidinium_carterae.1